MIWQQNILRKKALRNDVQLCVQADAGTGSSHDLAALPARLNTALDPKWSNSVKYKSIKAMAHNWTHSFMSGANYVDGEWVAEDVYRLTRALKDQRVVIWWIPNIEFDLPGVTDRVRNALRHYRENLMVHLQKHQVEQSMVREMRTEVFVAENLQMQVWSIAVDDRGRTYDQYVGV